MYTAVLHEQLVVCSFTLHFISSSFANILLQLHYLTVLFLQADKLTE